ncbi:hypothetical protein [Ruminococcus champanellensis]|uniref:hypothetical protein n=1 Tax=Ruminococcus champanellensis TaxID=1161942 RepID=UPI003AB46741
MKSTYIAALRDLIIAAASGIVVGSWMTGMTPFMAAMVLVVVAAVLDIAAEIRRQHESLDRMQQEALAESQRACDYYDVELRRAQEFDRHFDRHAEGEK